MNTEKSTNSLPQSKTVWVELPEFEFLCFNLARRLFGKYEPIPDFVTRYPGSLESCLEAPRQTFGGKLLYRTLISQSAILFYLLVKNHPFQNGNKRIAFTTLLVFLALNRKWLKTASYKLYILAMKVAYSKPPEKDAILKHLQLFIRRSIVTTPFR